MIKRLTVVFPCGERIFWDITKESHSRDGYIGKGVRHKGSRPILAEVLTTDENEEISEAAYETIRQILHPTSSAVTVNGEVKKISDFWIKPEPQAT